MSEEHAVVFILIKPDAVMRGLVGKILNRFEQRGFWINSLVTRFKNEEALKDIFEGVYDEDEWLEYLGKPLIGCILHCRQTNDSDRIEKIVGGFLRPELCSPGTIREEFGLNAIDNAINVFSEPKRLEAFYNPDTDRDPRRES